jgi:dTDP-4-dehydrorhamnose reductase
MAIVLVLGSSGMVGRAVIKRLREFGSIEVREAKRSADNGAIVLDALAPPPLEPLLEDVDLVVNAIGVLRNHPDYPNDAYRLEATQVNAAFPLLLAAAAHREGCRMIHISSDAVFEPAEVPADETTPVSPSEPYGLSKALGESGLDEVVNVRCSVIGPAPGRPSGLWEWFVSQPPGGQVRGFAHRSWTGVTSRQLAVLCGDLVADEAFARVRAAGPRQHFVPNGAITKLELLSFLRQELRPDVTVVPDFTGGVPGRPLWSQTDSLSGVFSGCRGWQEALREAAAAA